ncbi:mitochondrial fission ELM1 family protein [Rickettsiales bacterium]|nr:mitochondrial fission ELM1 family protein [Rickettsiales bacterium]
MKYSILLIVDEKISSSNQVLGLTNAISISKKNLNFKTLNSHKVVPGILPNWIIYYLLKFKLITLDSKFRSNDIDLIISCGRVSSPISLFIKEKIGCKNIHILDPYFKREEFDKIIIPKHDEYKKSNNFVEIIGAIVNEGNKNISLKKRKYFEKNLLINKSKKIITILLGGSGRSSRFDQNDTERLIRNLREIDKNKFQFFFLYSRRTPYLLKYSIRNAFANNSFIGSYEIDNPYWYLILNSDFFIVSSDSVSMTSDALSTMKPVFIFRLKKMKKKIFNFQNYLIKKKLTREFTGKIYSWKSKKVSEGKRIVKQVLANL